MLGEEPSQESLAIMAIISEYADIEWDCCRIHNEPIVSVIGKLRAGTEELRIHYQPRYGRVVMVDREFSAQPGQRLSIARLEDPEFIDIIIKCFSEFLSGRW